MTPAMLENLKMRMRYHDSAPVSQLTEEEKERFRKVATTVHYARHHILLEQIHPVMFIMHSDRQWRQDLMDRYMRQGRIRCLTSQGNSFLFVDFCIDSLDRVTITVKRKGDDAKVEACIHPHMSRVETVRAVKNGIQQLCRDLLAL